MHYHLLSNTDRFSIYKRRKSRIERRKRGGNREKKLRQLWGSRGKKLDKRKTNKAQSSEIAVTETVGVGESRAGFKQNRGQQTRYTYIQIECTYAADMKNKYIPVGMLRHNSETGYFLRNILA